MAKWWILIIVMIINGCVSPKYCDEEERKEDYSAGECIAAVGADVVLVAGAVVIVTLAAVGAAAGAGGDSTNTEPLACNCPDDLDSSGNRCGNCSAWSRPGGRQPYCYGVKGK